jgi:mono/diheme cytochrome c family protein
MKGPPTYRSEIRFEELLRDPRRVFGYTYPYFFVLLIVLGYVYVTHLTDVGKNAIAPGVPVDSAALVSDIPYQTPRTTPPVDVKAVAAPTNDLTSRGREVYRANCSSCHGDNGSGDGPAGAVLVPRPRNLHAMEGWTNGAKVSTIYRTLQEGIVRNGMPSFSYLSPQDRFALVHFVRSLHPRPPADAESEILQLETTYQLSKGFVVPGQVPIRVAAAFVEAEARQKASRTDSRARAIATVPHTEGTRLFQEVVTDPARVLNAFPVDSIKVLALPEFIHRVSADPGMLGFRPTVLQLTAGEWKQLFAVLTAEAK